MSAARRPLDPRRERDGEELVRRHFLRGRGASAGLVRVRPEIRARVAFRRVNLVDPMWLVGPGTPVPAELDAIFCRNVLIYFDRATQQRVLTRLTGHLRDGGLVVLGLSDGMRGMLGGLRHLGGAIYAKETAHAGDRPHR